MASGVHLFLIHFLRKVRTNLKNALLKPFHQRVIVPRRLPERNEHDGPYETFSGMNRVELEFEQFVAKKDQINTDAVGGQLGISANIDDLKGAD